MLKFFQVGVLETHRKTSVTESLFNQLAPLWFFQNDTPTQLLSCEFCRVFKNIIFTEQPRGSEFSSYEIDLRNRVTQNDVTLRVTNSKSKNKKFHFELLTRRLNFYFFYFRVTNSKLKNKKLHFELLTRSRKIKNYTSSY